MMEKSILAGMLIAIGCTVFISSGNSFVGAFLFSLGLLAIVVFRLELFTGKCGMLIRNLNVQYVAYLGKVWLGNFIGILMMCSILHFSRLEIVTEPIASIKLGDSWGSLFALGMPCGMLMHLAVTGFNKFNNPLMIVLPVMVFILCGFEHCIADMFYILYSIDSPASLLALAPITLGNVVGGMFSKQSLAGKNK